MITGLLFRMQHNINQTTAVFTTAILFFILSIPFNNIYEVVAMMTGNLSSWTDVLTPLFFKILKDIFLLVCILLMAVKIIKSPKQGLVLFSKPLLLLNIFTLILIITSLYSFSFMPANIVLMGIRGYWVLMLVYAGVLFCNLNERKIYLYIVAVFILHFTLQLLQFITDAGFRVYFEHRSPGIFIIPATAGAFSLLVYYFALKHNNNILKLIAFASLILSNSTVGLLSFVTYYIYSYRNKFKPKFIYYPLFTAVVIIVVYNLITNLDIITGRGRGVSTSSLARFNIIYLTLLDWKALLTGKGMGVASSQALLSGYDNAIIADNTYIGTMFNIGIIPAILIFCFIVWSFRYFENKLLFFTLIGYSMTTVVFELNPVIQIMLILLGVHIGRNQNKKTFNCPKLPHLSIQLKST